VGGQRHKKDFRNTKFQGKRTQVKLGGVPSLASGLLCAKSNSETSKQIGGGRRGGKTGEGPFFTCVRGRGFDVEPCCPRSNRKHVQGCIEARGGALSSRQTLARKKLILLKKGKRLFLATD